MTDEELDIAAEIALAIQAHDPRFHTGFQRLLEALKESRAEVKRLREHFDERWYECHDGSENACCKSHE